MSPNPNVYRRPPTHLSQPQPILIPPPHLSIFSPSSMNPPLIPSESMVSESETKQSRSRETPACSNSDGAGTGTVEDCSRERLKRHRTEMAGRVWIPETWGQEGFLKDWTDCTAFDKSLFPKGLTSAREALVQGCQTAEPGVIRTEKSC